MTPEESKRLEQRIHQLESALISLLARQQVQTEMLAGLSARLGCHWPPGAADSRLAEMETYWAVALPLPPGVPVPAETAPGEPMRPLPERPF